MAKTQLISIGGLFTDQNNGIYCLTSPNHPYLLTGMGDGTVMLWNYETSHMWTVIDTEQNCPVIGLEYLDNRLFIQTKNGVIKKYIPCVWHYYLLARTFPMDIPPLTKFVNIKVIRHGGVVLGVSRNNKLEFYRDAWTLSFYIRKNYGHIIDFKFVLLLDSLYVLIAFESGRLSLWHLNTKSEISYLFYPETPTAIDYSDIGIGILGTNTQTIHTFTIESLTLIHIKDLSIEYPGVSNIAIRPDNKLVAIIGRDNQIYLFSLENLEPWAILQAHNEWIRGVKYIENRRENQIIYSIVSAHIHGKLLFWDYNY